MSPALARYPEAAPLAHVHTVGTSPALADGAALVVLGSEAAAKRGPDPVGRLVAVAHHAVEPTLMLDGNPTCVRAALKRAGLALADVDLFEVNESFAAVPLHFMRETGVAEERLNVDGGAIAMGHPLGATGGVLLATLLGALGRIGGQYGVASICGGAGVTTSVVVERL